MMKMVILFTTGSECHKQVKASVSVDFYGVIAFQLHVSLLTLYVGMAQTHPLAPYKSNG